MFGRRRVSTALRKPNSALWLSYVGDCDCFFWVLPPTSSPKSSDSFTSFRTMIRYTASAHAKACRMSISLVRACLQHTKDADLTAY
jgi:hypothetical protein